LKAVVTFGLDRISGFRVNMIQNSCVSLGFALVLW